MQNKINENGKKILEFVNNEVNEKGYPPSVREICKAVGLKSTSTVHGYLVKLEKLGLIEKDPTKPRAIKVIKPESENRTNMKINNIPVIGKVTAGQPILAFENIEGSFPLPNDFISSTSSFMLRVQGDSMIDAGILDNDMIIVNHQSIATNGDIVVALIEEEATVKTFYKENNHIRLQPENDSYKPIIGKDNISVIGKVIGVIRKL
ncbi:MAG: transcriptional repressor LexA [Clostridiales bacterium]